MSKEDLKRRVLEEADFIKCLKHGNSLEHFLSHNKDDLENSTIARFLIITEEEVEEIYKKAIDELRKSMLKSEDEN